MKNIDQQVWDLLQDDQFVKWVHTPDEDSTAWWKNWMEQHPERPALLKQARELALDLAGLEKPEEAMQLAKEIWTGVQEKLALPAPAGETIPLYTRRSSRKLWYWAAACLLGLAVTGVAVRYALPKKQTTTRPGIQQVATLRVKEDLQRTNQTSGDQEVWLVDGSRVILQPGARIRHAAFLQKDKREIYLEGGNAFFEVAPDARRPFYVYTKDLEVRVLGTSFHVATNKDNGDVTVLVRSGKVAVSKKANPSHEQLILETNQVVLYKVQTHDLVQTSTNDQALPAQLPAPVIAKSLDFEEAPVAELFQTLEKAYGIPIQFDKKTFSSCMITTSLTDETFEEKLKIICEAIGATYKIVDNGVQVSGHPCKE